MPDRIEIESNKAIEDHELRLDRCETIPLERKGKNPKRPKDMRALFAVLEGREATEKFFRGR